MNVSRSFRGFRFPPDVILWAVRWYLQFAVSFRHLELMLADRGVQVDHVTLYRWTQQFAPEIETRVRRHLRPCRGPWHLATGSICIARSMSAGRPLTFCSAPNETWRPPGASSAVRWVGATRAIHAPSSPTGWSATERRSAP
jgi:hypothetical protein